MKFLDLFWYLLFLTFIFLCAEISFFIQCNQIYFNDFHIIANRIPIPYAIIPGILFFMVAHLTVHVGYTISICCLALLSKPVSVTSLKWGVTLWLLGIISILITNQYFFPNSKFAELSRLLLPDVLLPYLFFALCSFWAIITFMALSHLTPRRTFGLSLFFAFILAYWGYHHYIEITQDASSAEKPNLIIIGVDSLRPDFIERTQAKFFKDFLHQSTVFTHAFTPLARTYPSWIGILSGLYPKESGIRFNLAAQEPTHMPPLLPSILKAQGYKTIYATDETQFSNIDQSYGFDEAITPTMGLNNFLLGAFNDFPLSNLLVNTWVGKWLFPHSYANRPAFMTYDPETFLSALKPSLQQSRRQPLFLAVHFCLTHYPYLWRSHSGLADQKPLSRYQAAIVRVDQQVNDLMSMLERYHVLRHAIVVLLSDHGEALELAGDRITAPSAYHPKAKRIPRFYPPSADHEAVNQSAGHGTDVLGFSQYHAVLAFRLYGLGPQAIKSISNYALLLDIKPTLLDFLKVPDKSSGISLKSLILGQTARMPSRDRLFLESDFSPEAVRSVHPETRNLVFEGIEVFTIDPQTTRVMVKASMGQLIISSKQFANIDHDWVLALYPRDHEKMIPVLVHLPSGEWTTDLSTAFAQKSPHKRMLNALKKFYGKEIKQLAVVH